MWEIHARILNTKRVAATAVMFMSNVSPMDVWELLSLPEGAELFRVEGRVQCASDGCGRWEEQVVFTAAVRVLFWKALARTRVHQTIDASNPQNVTVNFRLLQSDLMSHLEGEWQLEQVAAAAPLTPAVTKVTYTFEMWPKGVPAGLRYMPGLMGAVKDAVRREAAQLVDKLLYVARKVRPGVTVQQALQETATEVTAAGGSFKLLQQALSKQHSVSSGNSSSSSNIMVAAAATAAAVQCHALRDDFHDADSEEVEEETMVDLDSECYCQSPRSSDASSTENISNSIAAESSSSSMDCSSLRISNSNSSSSTNTSECEDGACLIVEDVGSSSNIERTKLQLQLPDVSNTAGTY